MGVIVLILVIIGITLLLTCLAGFTMAGIGDWRDDNKLFSLGMTIATGSVILMATLLLLLVLLGALLG